MLVLQGFGGSWLFSWVSIAFCGVLTCLFIVFLISVTDCCGLCSSGSCAGFGMTGLCL